MKKQKRDRIIRIRWVDADGIYVPLDGRTLERPERAAARWTEQWAGPENVIYGHAVRALSDPVIEGRTFGIDTGCVFGGRLTAMVLYEGHEQVEFVQVRARASYHEPLLDTD